MVPGKLLLLENAQLNSPLQLQKRAGFTPLPQTILGAPSSMIQVGQGLTSYNDELLIADTNQLFSFSESEQSWVQKGALTSAEVTQFSVNRDAYNNDSQDGVVSASGLAIYAWRDVGEQDGGGQDIFGVYYSVVDTVTQQKILEAVPVGAGTSRPGSGFVKCQTFGQWLVVFYGYSGALYATCIPAGNPTAPTDIVISGSWSDFYDVCASTDGKRLFYTFVDAGAALNVGYLTLSLIPVNIGLTAGSVNQCVSIVGDLNPAASPETFFVTYGQGTNLDFQVVEYNLTVSTADTTLCATAGDAINAGALYNTASGQPNAQVYFTSSAATSSETVPYNNLVDQVSVTNLVPGSVTVLARSVSMAGKPFIYPFAQGGLNYILCNYNSGLGGIQNTYFLLDETGTVAAKLLALGAGGYNQTTMLPETTKLNATSFQWALQIQDNLVSSVSAAAQTEPLFSQTGVESVTVNFFDPAIAYARETMANVLHVTGGYLSMYDGALTVEHGFHVWPEQLTVQQTIGTALMDGTYSYVGVYEWVDGQGNIHQSAPSIPVQITISGGPADVSVTFPTLRLTQKAGVACVVYRTEMGGTQYFRVTDPGANYNTSDPTVDVITFTDMIPDANLVAGQNLYTFGGVVENISAPNCSAIDVFDNRLWVLPSDSRLGPWYSKIVSPGLPVQFSDLFTFNVDPRGGNITAMINMDANQVFFKETSIWYTYGTGPDATGANSTYASAQLITSDAGCSEPRSVVLMPAGVMFKSEKGIYLLGRDLSVNYIGADVAAYNTQTVVGATLVSNRNQVRFLLNDNQMLIYDYYMRAWSTRPSWELVDATVFQENYCYLQANGRVMQQSTGFDDAGEFYPLKVQTSWLSFAGISGWQRVKGMMLLGDYRSPHSLKIYVAYDYDPTPTQVCVINADPFDPGFWGDDTVWGGDDVWGGYYPSYQFRVNFDRQKCSAVQITIQDQQDFIQPGEGYALSNLCFVVGVKRDWKKVGAERIFGGTGNVPTEY